MAKREVQDVALLKRSARDYARIFKPKPHEISALATEKFARYKLGKDGMRTIRNEMRKELGYTVSE